MFVSYIRSYPRRFLYASVLGVACCSVLLWYLCSAPLGFPVGHMVSIPRGASVKEAAAILYEQHVIRFKGLFALLDRGGVQAGGYLFDRRENIFTVAVRLKTGEFRLPQVTLVFPEGITVKDMAARCKTSLSLCDEKTFIALATPKEGYLFPDTYYFNGDAQAREVVSKLALEFAEKIKPFESDIQKSGRTLSEIITMASILEEEANSDDSRKIVSGILWKRIGASMPLQADSTLTYVTGRGSKDLTTDDLASTSPFNTYTHKGLPPTPISNPGLAAIDAALHPKMTAYWYYLTDAKGTFYYARTFEEHKANRLRYLGQ